MEAMMPKVRPNQKLISGLELMLAKARLGEITDGVLIGRGYTDPGGQEPWFHHYSIEREDDVINFVGEMDIFKDILKSNIHNTRNRATQARGTQTLGAGMAAGVLRGPL